MGLTRYQAVRSAILELGPTASKEDIAKFVEKHHGMKFDDDTVVLYISMVNSKMSRKQRKSTSPSSAMLPGKRP